MTVRHKQSILSNWDYQKHVGPFVTSPKTIADKICSLQNEPTLASKLNDWKLIFWTYGYFYTWIGRSISRRPNFHNNLKEDSAEPYANM